MRTSRKKGTDGDWIHRFFLLGSFSLGSIGKSGVTSNAANQFGELYVSPKEASPLGEVAP